MGLIASIIEKGISILQEQSPNNIQETAKDFYSNTKLKESALIEAFNLKAAIEYNLKNYNNALEAIKDMP